MLGASHGNTPAAQTQESVERLVHELQVHQIELESQNEALRDMQLALEESRDRYRELYEFAPVGYLSLTAQGQIAEINLTGTSLLARPRETLLHANFANFVIPADRERWRLGCLENQHHDGPNTMELMLKRGDGSAFHAQLTLDAEKPGAGNATIRIALTDISRRKRAEREREHGLARIQSLMKHANDCIIMFDEDARIIDISDSCLRLYGYTREEMLALNAVDLHTADVRDDFPYMLRELRNHGSLSYQTWHHSKDGLRFPIEVGATMIDMDGYRYFQTIIRDVSDKLRQRIAMENGLNAAKRRLTELSRHLVEAQEDARRRLSGELHDRTSSNLAAIQVNLSIISATMSGCDACHLDERLADTQALVEDTDTSIREISADLRCPVLDYAGLPAAVEGYALRYASRTGIAVNVETPGSDTRLAPDMESLLFRIFQEAMTNSLKHGQARLIEVAINLDAQPIVLSIIDDGVGFDPQTIGQDTGSRGMGLSNMRQMAEIAGGKILIQSRRGQGTRVEVRIEA